MKNFMHCIDKAAILPHAWRKTFNIATWLSYYVDLKIQLVFFIFITTRITTKVKRYPRNYLCPWRLMHHMLRSSMAMEIMKIVTLRNWWILQPRFADLSIYEEEYTTQWSTQFKSQSICQLLSNPFKHSNPKVLQLAKCSWIASCGLL